MRLSTDEDRNEERAVVTIAAAVEAGITVFDTARSYGLGAEELGHNERLLARTLRSGARVITKGGMARAGGAWIPDGRARTIRSDCEASLEALDGLPIDLYLVHAPDPRTPWRTTVRALARIVDDGLVDRVGVCNVTRGQLDEALDLAPIAAVQVALSPFEDRALRGGVVERCDELGIALVAHSPLGGPRRTGRLGRREDLARVADAHEATPAEVALAWLLGLSTVVVAIPGARRPETARSSARAATLELELSERELLERALGGLRSSSRRRGAAQRDGEVVVVMGIPGAGKSRIAESYEARGHERLNRDQRGGSLRDIAAALDDVLAAGASRVVLDNTYLTRAARSHVVEIAARHGLPTRCVWLDTPLAQAQVNLVERLLDHFGSLPTPEELKQEGRRVPGLHTPTTQMRTLRELEPPGPDEGFVEVERVPFERTASEGVAGVFVAAAVLASIGWERMVAETDPTAPHLVFDWRTGAVVDELDAVAGLLAKVVSGPVERALCPHSGGPPTCWCRPPLPGLPLAFAHSHGVDPARSTLVGTSTAHRTLAATLGARYEHVG